MSAGTEQRKLAAILLSVRGWSASFQLAPEAPNRRPVGNQRSARCPRSRGPDRLKASNLPLRLRAMRE